MCYLVTATPSRVEADNINFSEEFPTLGEAKQAALKLAESSSSLCAYNVKVWLLTHSVEIQPQAVWKEHAKGLSGA